MVGTTPLLVLLVVPLEGEAVPEVLVSVAQAPLDKAITAATLSLAVLMVVAAVAVLVRQVVMRCLQLAVMAETDCLAA